MQAGLRHAARSSRVQCRCTPHACATSTRLRLLWACEDDRDAHCSRACLVQQLSVVDARVQLVRAQGGASTHANSCSARWARVQSGVAAAVQHAASGLQVPAHGSLTPNP
jgi:hypothetical protein